MSRLRFAVRVMRPLPFPDFSYSFFAVYRRSGCRFTARRSLCLYTGRNNGDRVGRG